MIVCSMPSCQTSAGCRCFLRTPLQPRQAVRNYLREAGLLSDFERVLEIAARNEASPEIDRVKQAIHP